MSVTGSPVVSGIPAVVPPVTPAPVPASTFPTTTGSSANKLSIINMALIMLQTNPVQSLEQGTPHLTAALALYDAAVDEVLRAHSWNFATKRVALPAVIYGPVYGYAYAYQLPGDCLRIMAVSCQRLEDLPGFETSVMSYRVETNQVLTDETTCYLQYVARLTDPARFDALFINAFTANLAMKLAYALAGSSSQQELMARLYGDYLAQARSISADEQQGPTSWTDTTELLQRRDGFYTGLGAGGW